MVRRISMALALSLGLAAPAAQADPTVGFGLSIALGGSSPDVGFGVRLFSDDEQESAVASIGVDYIFRSNSLRPTVGVAYLDKDFYLGLDLGYNFASGGIDYGVSAGGVDTESPKRSSGNDTPDDGDVDDGDPIDIGDGPTDIGDGPSDIGDDFFG